jgi:hypothetical protein
MNVNSDHFADDNFFDHLFIECLIFFLFHFVRIIFWLVHMQCRFGNNHHNNLSSKHLRHHHRHYHCHYHHHYHHCHHHQNCHHHHHHHHHFHHHHHCYQVEERDQGYTSPIQKKHTGMYGYM